MVKQDGSHLAQGLAPVAQSVFFLVSQLGHGQAGFREVKDRVITKAACPCCPGGNQAFHLACSCSFLDIRENSSYGAVKAGCPVLAGISCQPAVNFSDLGRIIRFQAGKTCRMQARRPIQDID